MTNTVTRDEFEEVKQLLGSAARYAESANRGLERLEVAQQRSQLQIDQLTAKIDQLTIKLDQPSDRVDSFIAESQRIMTGQTERIAQLEGISGRLEAILSYLVRQEGPGE